MRRTVLSLIILGFAAACAKAPTPKEFLAKAIQGDDTEMLLGTLAATKGGTAVADYGRTLAADRAKDRAAVVSVATHYGMTLPSDLLPEARKQQSKLEGLSGAEFDKAYVSAMVKAHKADDAAFAKEATSGEDPDIKAFASKTDESVVKMHLQMIEDIQSKMK